MNGLNRIEIATLEVLKVHGPISARGIAVHITATRREIASAIVSLRAGGWLTSEDVDGVRLFRPQASLPEDTAVPKGDDVQV